jgi:hypothetical protein
MPLTEFRGLDDGNIRPDEFERDDVLLQYGVLEYPPKDHFVLLQKCIVAGEELAPNVGERTVGGELAGVRSRITPVPGGNLILNDLSNGGFVSSCGRLELTRPERFGQIGERRLSW